uniref:Uncharacterized protein n=1 Tax=Fagus sylvatica TaxID=28930 RepID=A0A2N9J9H7_FAGSY
MDSSLPDLQNPRGFVAIGAFTRCHAPIKALAHRSTHSRSLPTGKLLPLGIKSRKGHHHWVPARDDEGIRTTEKGKDMALHQVSDESDDNNGPPFGFERYRDFDDLPMDADTGQDNDDEMNSINSDYDDRNLRMDD